MDNKAPKNIDKIFMNFAAELTVDLDLENAKGILTLMMKCIFDKCVSCISMKMINQCEDTACPLYNRYITFAELIDLSLYQYSEQSRHFQGGHDESG